MIDLYSRRLLGAATGLHPDADLACAAIKMAVATRGGVDAVNGPNWREDESQRVIFHTDSKCVRCQVFPGFVTLTSRPTPRTRSRSCALSWESANRWAGWGRVLTMPPPRRSVAPGWEVLSRHDFADTRQAQAVVLEWCYGFCNHDRRHSSAGMMSPINYENTAAPDREAA